MSFKYFAQVVDELPWYIKKAYNSEKLCFKDVLRKLEEDEAERGTKINIYNALEHIYCTLWWELSGIFGVKFSVVSYAVCRGTVDKREKQFSLTLCILEDCFDVFYSKQLDKLERCKEKFYSFYGEEWIRKMKEKAHVNLKS